MVRLLTLVLISVAAMCAVALSAPSFQTGEEIEVSGARDDMAFASGGDIRVTAAIADALFIAGGDLTFEGAQVESVITAGGDLSFTNVLLDDVIAAGGDINFTSGSIADDLVLTGGDITIGHGFTVAGSSVIAGGDLTVGGAIGNATIRAGEFTLSGTINGDANIEAAHLVIAPGARIDGNLTHRARSVEISPDAVITGQVTALGPRVSNDQIFKYAFGGMIAMALVIFVGSIVLTLALVGLFPVLMWESAEAIRTQALVSVAIGLLWAILVPVIAVCLFVTLIGLPLGAVLLGIYVLAFPFASAAFAYFVGMMLRRMTRNTDPPGLGGRLGWTLLAAVIICAVCLVPFIGGVACLLGSLFGLGGFIVAARRVLGHQHQAA